MSETCMEEGGEEGSREGEGKGGGRGGLWVIRVIMGIYYEVVERRRGDTESLLRISKCFPRREIRS